MYSIVRLDEEAVLQYRVESDQVWDLYHTGVPTSQRGKGLGAVLAQVSVFSTFLILALQSVLLTQAALSHMREHHIKGRLTCSYLQHYLTKNTSFADIVIN